MRSSRLLAASALVALSLGATVGAATASAVGVPATPTPTGSTTATATAAPTTTATGTPAPTTPTGRPTVVPTPPMPSPNLPCPGGVHTEDLKVTGSGLSGATLVKGGAAQEMTVTFENTSTVDLQKLNAFLFVANVAEESQPATQPSWGKDAFDLQAKLPGADWKPVSQDAIKNDMSYIQADLGTYKLAKGEKLTFQVRLAATAKAFSTRYFGQLRAESETIPSQDVPGARQIPGGCSFFSGNYHVADFFKVVDAAATPATTPAATTAPAAAASASPSTSPSAGPHLAETGASSNTLPIAVGGAAVLVAGAGTLFFLRRRKAGTHS